VPQQPVAQAGEPGTYAVQRGDTLAKIALDHGVSWRDLARWNQIDNPNVIEVGQVLRVTPPDAPGSRPLTSRPLPPQGARASATSPPATTPSAPAVSGSTAAGAPQVAAPAAPAANTTSGAAPEDAPAFQWPAQGSLLGGFEESRNKGLDIGGKAGDPVLAAADGRVVYAGSGLRGYGNLIILKHNNTYLSAYAHNQALMVKEDQEVKRGQKIAEMGNTDADQVKLHFEIRRQGKPVDPARLLPPR
jgi:lipoprotein NlpD